MEGAPSPSEEATLLVAERGLPVGSLLLPSVREARATETWARRWRQLRRPLALLVALASLGAIALLRWRRRPLATGAAELSTELAEQGKWRSYPGYDFPLHDVEHLPAENLEAVKRRCVEKACAGFAVNTGTAWLKGRQGSQAEELSLAKDDLKYLGSDVTFYIRPEGAAGLPHHAAQSHGSAPAAPAPAAPAPAVAKEDAPAVAMEASQALLCTGWNSCGSFKGLKRWKKSPKDVAENVTDFSELPGVYSGTYDVVKGHWESSPPLFQGSPVTLQEIADFARETLRSDPFGTGDQVPYVDLGPGSTGRVVALSQWQLAFIVANALMGNSIEGGDGLTAALDRCTTPTPTTAVTSTSTRTTTTTTTTSWTSTSTTSSSTATQAGGALNWIGGVLNMFQRSNVEDPVEVDSWAEQERRRKLRSQAPRRLAAGSTDIVHSLLSLLAVLSRELAGGKAGTMIIAATPGGFSDAWRQRLGQPLIDTRPCLKVAGWKNSCPTPDFMSGGVKNQAVTDIAGAVIGGGANLCNHANSQDESLVQFYSEVLALAFFAPPLRGGMLSVPMTVLGARRYVSDISGETSWGAPYFNQCGALPRTNWLNQDIPTAQVGVALQDRQVSVAASAFVAVASLSTDSVAVGQCSFDELVNNRCDAQRRHLDDDITRWYQVYEPTMYNPVVQQAVRGVVRRAGTGPWGAGLWHGDSQQYFLAVWLATSLVGGGLQLDYYIYDHFCENGGNQCFVLGKNSGCEPCIKQGGSTVDAGRCGNEDIWGMIGKLKGQASSVLYNALQKAPKPPVQVFDGLGL